MVHRRWLRRTRCRPIVATDVLGHGVNLPCETLLFAETSKFDGQERRELLPWELAQIAGRAGRFGLVERGHVGVLAGVPWAHADPGLVESALEPHVELPGGHRGYRAIQAINGIGPTMAAILVAEIGDVARFRSAAALCSWAGLTPKHKESDTTVRRGGVTKQGSRLVRWAVIEGTVRYHGGGKLAANYRAIEERRGKNKATVAIARKVLTLVYYGLRDGEIRCLARAA